MLLYSAPSLFSISFWNLRTRKSLVRMYLGKQVILPPGFFPIWPFFNFSGTFFHKSPKFATFFGLLIFKRLLLRFLYRLFHGSITLSSATSLSASLPTLINRVSPTANPGKLSNKNCPVCVSIIPIDTAY